MSDQIEIQAGGVAARILLQGAELTALSISGHPLLWSPDPALWDGTCPILFPIIGRVNNDVLLVGGAEYPMPMHGLALTRGFSIVEHGQDCCTLALRSSADTRRCYPYDFTLQMTYRVTEKALLITAEIRNNGSEIMPASLGLHPGFRWPLLPGVQKSRHFLTFDESGPIVYTRPVERLIGSDRFELALEGNALRLDEALFEQGGLAFLSLKSRSLRFHTDDDAASIRIEFPDMDRLVLWSKPGGDFLCIEPCLGHADPVGFAGDLRDKPGMAQVAPGHTLRLSVTITPEFAPA